MNPPPSPPTSVVDGTPARPGQGEPAHRRVLWLALLIAFCALGIIGIVTYVGWNIGPLALGVGIVGAILPVPVLVGCFLWLDRYQPSPLWIFLTCFLWGAGVATSGALAVNTLASHAFDAWGLPDALVGVLVAPFIEELLKAALPLLLFVVYRRAFTSMIDGIVYCGLSATGFAMVENILYLGGHGFASESSKGYAAGALAATAIFIVRVPLTGFAHPLFTTMVGVGLGVATRSPSRSVRILAPLCGLIGAMMLHGAWNLMATLAQRQIYILLYGYFAVFVPIFFATVGLVLWIRSREGRLAERVLPVYADAGWFSPPEVAALGTLARRLAARRWANRVAGEPGQAAMRAYQIAATQLAQVRDGLDRGLYPQPTDLANAVARERRLLAEIDAHRRVFTGRDPLTPRAWWSAGGYQIQFPDGAVRPVAAPALPVVPVPFVLVAAGPGFPSGAVVPPAPPPGPAPRPAWPPPGPAPHPAWPPPGWTPPRSGSSEIEPG